MIAMGNQLVSIHPSIHRYPLFLLSKRAAYVRLVIGPHQRADRKRIMICTISWWIDRDLIDQTLDASEYI